MDILKNYLFCQFENEQESKQEIDKHRNQFKEEITSNAIGFIHL